MNMIRTWVRCFLHGCCPSMSSHGASFPFPAFPTNMALKEKKKQHPKLHENQQKGWM